MARAHQVNQKHQDFLDDHFQAGVPSNWRAFHRNLRSKAFTRSVRRDPRADAKLKRFVRMVSLRQSSRRPGVAVTGDTGKSYKIRYHPEARRFSCSCKDWTFAKSHKRKGSGGDCKHINRIKSGVRDKMTEKVAFSVLGRAAATVLNS